MQKSVFAVLMFLTMVCCGLAQATPMKWSLSGVTFSDSSNATGSFFYDASTGEYSNWLISIGAGSLGAFTYNTVDSQIFLDDANEFLIIANNNSRYFNFSFADVLTDAGGSIALNTATNSDFDESSWECNDCKITRFVTGGSIVAANDANIATVPEPATLLLTGAALAALTVLRRKTIAV